MLRAAFTIVEVASERVANTEISSMADQQSGSSSSGSPFGGVDAITGFWRDVMARTSAGAGMPGMPNMPGMGQPVDASVASAFTPEAMRRMQGAFFEAMAQYTEQYMRSPQFLEAMKRSMDQAMQFRQQMDDFLKSNMATAFESATGGSNSEILGAIRHSSALLQSQIAKIDARVGDLEAVITGKPKAESSASKTSSKPAAKKTPKR